MSKNSLQQLFIKDNHMIQTFSADRADHAFHVSALPGRSRVAENLFDIHDFDLFAELLSVDPITISQQIFRCCVEGKGVEHLLRGPFGRGMTCHAKVDDSLWSLDLFRCESVALRTYWVLVVMDLYTENHRVWNSGWRRRWHGALPDVQAGHSRCKPSEISEFRS